jgi:hypothetical protein
MAITSLTAVQFFDVTQVTAVSNLAGKPIYYFWYLDGSPQSPTTSPTRSFRLDPGQQAEILCLDSLDPDFDAVANAPPGFPARRTLFWIRSLATAVDHYRVEESSDGGATWTPIGQVQQLGPQWTHALLTPPLADLTGYRWRIVPVDAAGNDGAALAPPAEFVVRRPDAPQFAISYDASANRVSFEQ